MKVPPRPVDFGRAGARAFQPAAIFRQPKGRNFPKLFLGHVAAGWKARAPARPKYTGRGGTFKMRPEAKHWEICACQCADALAK